MHTTPVPPTRPLRVAYLGNFRPEHSTENHVARAWENNGHMLHRVQEGEPTELAELTLLLAGPNPPDLVMWTRTGGLSALVPKEQQVRMLATAEEAGIPTVAYHLDRWWGLDRAGQVEEEAFFQCELVVTADGGHHRQWAEAGVNHYWLPPAVSLTEASREPSSPRARQRYKMWTTGFVGNLDSYHPEWLPHRQQLKAHMQRWYGRKFYNVAGGVRGQQLVDLYRSVPVFVGDSCLAPNADGGVMANYWSDRIPETLGRGGYLIHPDVPGLLEAFTDPDGTYRGPATYPLGDWETLHLLIEQGLRNPALREFRSETGRRHVLEQHTYERRMEQVLAELVGRGWRAPR